eukprot:373698-Rhodomonas_salina.1
MGRVAMGGGGACAYTVALPGFDLSDSGTGAEGERDGGGERSLRRGRVVKRKTMGEGSSGSSSLSRGTGGEQDVG